MHPRESTILLAEHDAAAREQLALGFRSEGYTVIAAETAAATRSALAGRRFCLAVIEDQLSGDGIHFGAAIRRDFDIPVVILASQADEESAVSALDAGADDYVPRPFGTRELVARANAVLRRAHTNAGPGSATIQLGGVVLDPTRRTIRVHDQTLQLTPTEYGLFGLLAQNCGHVLPHARLLHVVWGEMHLYDYHMLHVNICRLRRKLARVAGGHDVEIRTVPGIGYALHMQRRRDEQVDAVS